MRREELLAALESVVARHGYIGATVPRVVAEARAAQGSFYRYFRDLDDAFLELARRTIAPIAAAALEMDFSGARTAADIEAELLRYYRVLARELAMHPAVVHEALLVAPAARGRLGRELQGFFVLMRERAQALVERYMGSGPFRVGDAPVIAGAVVGMVVGATHEAAHLGKSLDPERWAAEMAKFEAGALCGPGSGRRTQTEEEMHHAER